MLNFDEMAIFCDHNQHDHKPPYSIPEQVDKNKRDLIATLERLKRFEDELMAKCEHLVSVMTQDNVTFKNIIEEGWKEFVKTVRTEVNLYETNVDALIALYRKTMEEKIEQFMLNVNDASSAMHLEVVDAVSYMKANLNETIDNILHEMETNGEMIGTIETDVVVSIKKFGAVGDGEHDDTEAFQTAVNRSNTVLVPAGYYKLTDTIILHTNSHVICEEGAVLLGAHKGAFFLNGEKSDTTTGGYNAGSNITFEGGILDFSAHTGGRAGIAFGHAHDITIKGVTFRDTVGGHAVELGGCKNVLIDGCKFEGFVQLDRDNIEAIQVELSHPEGFLEFGLSDLTPSEHVTVQNCYFGESALNPAPNVAFGHHGATYGVMSFDISFINNTVKGCTYAGIRACHWEAVTIKNNHFIDCIKAVMIDGVANAEMEYNVPSGEPVSCYNVEVSNNDFFRCDPAIWCWARQNESSKQYAEPEWINVRENLAVDCTMFLYSSNVVTLNVMNNNVEWCKETALSINNDKNVDVHGNVFRGCKANVIQVKDIDDEEGVTKNVSINANKFRDCKRNCIYARSCNTITISDNTFENCSSTPGDHPVYIHNFIDNSVIQGNVSKAEDAMDKTWCMIFGTKNGLILVANNIALNYQNVLLAEIGESSVKQLNNYAQ